jgi:hypothetical protein
MGCAKFFVEFCSMLASAVESANDVRCGDRLGAVLVVTRLDVVRTVVGLTLP